MPGSNYKPTGKEVIKEFLDAAINDDILSNSVLVEGADKLAWLARGLMAIIGILSFAYTFYRVVMQEKGTWRDTIFRLGTVSIILLCYTLLMPIVTSILDYAIEATNLRYENKPPSEWRYDLGKIREELIQRRITEAVDVENIDSELGFSTVDSNNYIEEELDEAGRKVKAEMGVDGNAGTFDFKGQINEWIAETFAWFSFSIGSIIKLLLLGIRSVLLPIFYLIGPFAIVLSAVPGYESSGVDWLKTFIAIYLWRAIINLMDYLTMYQAELFGSTDINSWISMIFFLAFGFAYITVPEICKTLTGSAFGASVDRAMQVAIPYAAAIAKMASKAGGTGLWKLFNKNKGDGKGDVVGDMT
ncbi:hypothetical protein [Xanthovirga aplysinae]|uniref:hypothetical protein n=1 Tax=Xanthovirga aplysinae TaxID=2529853 RepID=UPI0012BD68A1|nr:hypothetical protein [Xanthovirga aplysinae]MTI33299.1 hypothetical protein [Xanthovirga aplysinae]